jgi:hypothetical protein
MTTATVFPQTQALTANLSDATVSILQQAFWLSSQRQALSNKKYKQFLASLGWSFAESRIYLKLATAFTKFAPDDLKYVEPNTILVLAKHQKKYNQVIDKLQDCGRITQEVVRELIAAVHQPKAPKSNKPSIWKTAKDGKPVCRIPDIMESDRQTGMIIQKEIDENGTVAQTLIREAVALWQAFKDGKLAFVEDIVGEECQDVTTDNLSNEVETEEPEDVTQESQYSYEVPMQTHIDIVDESIELQAEDGEVVADTVDDIQDFQMLQVDSIILPQEEVIEDEVSMIAGKILEVIKEGQSWSEIVKITENCSRQIKTSAWQLLDTNNKKILLEIKEKFERIPQVNDKVIWINCPSRLSSWQPFLLMRIEGDNAFLDMYKNPVPFVELEKFVGQNIE